MKVGTFVGKVDLPLTETEQNIVLSNIKSYCDNAFGVDKYSISQHKLDNTDTVYYRVIPTCFVKDNITALRLSDKNLCHFNYISFGIGKQKGYDEAVTGKCYVMENGKPVARQGFNPEYNMTSFYMRVTVYGNTKKYRAKTTYMGVGVDYHGKALWGYEYGTEVSDLFNDNISNILNKTQQAVETGKKTNVVLSYV